jgi:cyclic pyranopterin phosphate synthase
MKAVEVMENAPRKDSFGRTIDYLRISVTDRCNERCLYCMPQGYTGWSKKADHLSAEEILKVVRASCALGFRKFRLTGGEPLLREDIVQIAGGIAALPGVQTLGISTNGTRLARHARAFKTAGVQSLNISLDVLSPEVYRHISGGNIHEVFEGLDAALGEAFAATKLNCVLMRGINEDEIWPLTQFAASRNIPVRFIERMPLSKTGATGAEPFLRVDDALHILSRHDELEALTDYNPGHGPARYYGLKHTKARVGFIGALTTPDFCQSCNKLRLTADGKIRPCLGRHGELDLTAALRSGGDVQAILTEAVGNKPENHAFAECYEPGRPMTAIGG